MSRLSPNIIFETTSFLFTKPKHRFQEPILNLLLTALASLTLSDSHFLLNWSVFFLHSMKDSAYLGYLPECWSMWIFCRNCLGKITLLWNLFACSRYEWGVVYCRDLAWVRERIPLAWREGVRIERVSPSNTQVCFLYLFFLHRVI